MCNCYYIVLTSATRESSRSVCWLFSEIRVRLKELFHTIYCGSPSCMPHSDSLFWRKRFIEPEEKFQGCTKSWACCILLLGWHNCDFKGKWKSSVSYPCWCCMLSCNADLFLFSRGLEIGTSTATFEVGHGLLTDVAAALHAFYRNQKTDSYRLYKLPY